MNLSGLHRTHPAVVYPDPTGALTGSNPPAKPLVDLGDRVDTPKVLLRDRVTSPPRATAGERDLRTDDRSQQPGTARQCKCAPSSSSVSTLTSPTLYILV
jgi:hypothetical protein